MTAYLLRRLLQGLYVILGLSVLVFMILHITGDPALVILPPNVTAQELADFRQKMGFNDPLYVQYLRFLSRGLQGDFGMSFMQAQPALGLVLERMPATFELAVASLALSITLAVPAGILAALHKDRLLDFLGMLAALLGQSMPAFWLGLLLLMVFSIWLDLLPVSGRGSFQHLLLPAITLGSFTAARIARLTRSEMLEVLGQEFVNTARAKGLREWAVVIKHTFANAVVPVLSVVTLEAGTVLGGAVITETIFSWPGVGRLMVDAIFDRDFPVVQAGVLTISVLLVLLNIVADVVYAWLDPRIRFT
jgi:ABC-type dipeptide/oligopeptide/nickel transport system permease component